MPAASRSAGQSCAARCAGADRWSRPACGRDAAVAGVTQLCRDRALDERRRLRLARASRWAGARPAERWIEQAAMLAGRPRDVLRSPGRVAANSQRWCRSPGAGAAAAVVQPIDEPTSAVNVTRALSDQRREELAATLAAELSSRARLQALRIERRSSSRPQMAPPLSRLIAAAAGALFSCGGDAADVRRRHRAERRARSS